MNPSSSSSRTPVFTDYHQRATNVRSKILKNEEQRLQLEQKLRFMSTNNPRSYQRKQIQYIQNYFTRLNQESQRAEQRNLQLIHDLTQAQEHLDRLHYDSQHLIQLKNDYLNYLETTHPNWQKPISIPTSTNTSNEYDRLVQHMKHQQNQLENDGNLRQSSTVPLARQSYDVDSSMLFKRYEDQLKVGFERTISPPTFNKDEHSISESNPFSRVKSNGSLRMELTRTGLYCLLDYIEKEIKVTIHKKKFYNLDPPTINQKRTIIDLANDQQILALKDHDSATISMIILDQLPSTIRRTTVNQCLLTEDILSSNIKDLDKDIIAKILPESDRLLWSRLIDHFIQLLKLHIMDSQTLVNKFALAFLPPNVLYIHDKAKSLLKHIIEKNRTRQVSSSDDDDDISTEKKPQPSSTWLKKLTNGSSFDDDLSTSSTTTTPTAKKNNKSPTSTATTPKANTTKDESDQDFFN